MIQFRHRDGHKVSQLVELCVLPKRFGGVELWRVTRQKVHFQPWVVRCQRAKEGSFVHGPLVVDQYDRSTLVSQHRATLEGRVGFGG